MSNDIVEKFPMIARLRRGYMAACEIESIQSGCRAWVGIYPIHSSAEFKHKGDYRIRVFEVEEKYLINDNDVWEGVMQSRADIRVFGEADLIRATEQFTDPTRLGAPQDCDYPV